MEKKIQTRGEVEKNGVSGLEGRGAKGTDLKKIRTAGAAQRTM